MGLDLMESLGINAAGRGLKKAGSWFEDKFGNPMDWGKNPVDPSVANLQDAGYLRDYIKGRLGGIEGRQAPQVGAARIAGGPQGQWRGQQMSLAQQLAGVASGQQKGAGELAVGRQFAQGTAAQMAAARMARGAGAAQGARAAARGIGNMTVDASGAAQRAALDDQTAARGLLAGVLGQGREQDIGLASGQAGLDQQANLANQAAKLQQMGMNDAQIAQMLGQLYGISATEMQGRIGIAMGNAQQQGYLGSLMQGAGQAAAMAAMSSDRRTKTNIEPGEEQVREFLDTLEPHVFEYRDEKHGKGRYLGVMAQDVERSALGREMVIDGETKALDVHKVISALLASVADLNRRLAKAEGR